MATVVLDPSAADELIRDRQARGLDRWDEVWDGVYMVMPLANNEHQDIGGGLYTILRIQVDWPGLGRSFPGVNVSDRAEGWKQNYRCPDIAVYLNGNPSRDCGTHWLGGPDFAVEIVSPDDRSREKLAFYASVGVRELLVIDRAPWGLELYRSQGGELVPVGESNLQGSQALASEVLPLSFRLVPGEPRPRIEVVHTDGRQRWLV